MRPHSQLTRRQLVGHSGTSVSLSLSLFLAASRSLGLYRAPACPSHLQNRLQAFVMVRGNPFAELERLQPLIKGAHSAKPDLQASSSVQAYIRTDPFCRSGFQLFITVLISVAIPCTAALAGISVVLLATLLLDLIAPEKIPRSLTAAAAVLAGFLLLISTTAATLAFHKGRYSISDRIAAATKDCFVAALLGTSLAWIFAMIPFLFAAATQTDTNSPLHVASAVPACFCGIGGCFGVALAVRARY